MLALILAIVALVLGAFALIAIFLFPGGILRRQVPVRLPTVTLTGRTTSPSSTSCGDKEFSGTVKASIVYPPAPPPTRATVRITLDIVNRSNVEDVQLGQSDLGTFSNDAPEGTIFTGKLNNACNAGSFSVRATTVNQGPGSTTVVTSVPIDVPASKIATDKFPQVARTLQDGVHFNTTEDAAPNPPSITLRNCTVDLWILFSRPADNLNVTIDSIVPVVLPANATLPVVVSGQKDDPDAALSYFVLRARNVADGSECRLGLIKVE